MDELQELRSLTEKLPPVLTTYTSELGCNFVRYEVEGGHCFGHGLFNDGSAACQWSFMTKGAAFERHVHRAHEFLVVVSGFLEVRVNGTVIEVASAESIRLGPGEPHSVEAKEHTVMFGITIPSEEGYPNA